ncbi:MULTISPECIES: hypothetical protein [unclassified Variovorax]|uniref:hypothetical protein n=1 Tax=unclassified Variovorax TaxID=663243 RepID=UPI003F44EFAA
MNSSNPNIASSHRNGYVEELNLANQVVKMPGEAVVSYGDVIGGHGADVTSVNTNTSQVSLWDDKYRGNSRVIQPNPTFEPGSDALDNAIAQARQDIIASSLPTPVKMNAFQNLQNGNFTANTTGSGNAKNSVPMRFCNFSPC